VVLSYATAGLGGLALSVSREVGYTTAVVLATGREKRLRLNVKRA
jgi:ABC-type phosphate transport system permease subunit